MGIRTLLDLCDPTRARGFPMNTTGIANKNITDRCTNSFNASETCVGLVISRRKRFCFKQSKNLDAIL